MDVPTFSVTAVIAVAVVVPVVSLASRATARAVGRWIGRSVKASMVEAVDEIVAPRFDRITESFDELRHQNTVDHDAVSARLDALERRLGDLEAQLKEAP